MYIYKNIIPERFENARENHENMVKYYYPKIERIVVFYYEIRQVHVEHLSSDYPQIILLTYSNEKIILEYSKGFILEFESHLNYILDSIFED